MRRLRAVLLLLAAGIALAATRPHPDWTSTVAVTPEGGHLIGNPQAPVKLVEYISYTCPHCAHFATEADAPLRLTYVQGGKVSVEIRHLVRDPVDLTVAMLTNCGSPARFLRNHNAFLFAQATWIAPAMRATDAQRERWDSGPVPARLRAIASDLDLYAIMTGRGYRRAEIDRCLGDPAMLQRLSRETAAAAEAGINLTPSFALDGVVLAGTHDWPSLEPQLRARF